MTEADLDAVVARVLQQKFAAGLFDAGPTNPGGTSILDSAAHRQLAREAATQGIVLLKNDKATLPMALSGKTVALFGQLASDEEAMVGSYVLSGAKVSPPPPLASAVATCSFEEEREHTLVHLYIRHTRLTDEPSRAPTVFLCQRARSVTQTLAHLLTIIDTI